MPPTSATDLYRLCHEMGLDVCIIRLCQLKSCLKKRARVENYIINLDSYGHGSHWVALNTKKKLYFDSYAEEMPRDVPRDYKKASDWKQLQSLEAEDCGPLCCLWLKYINSYSNKEYYDLFEDVYK